MRTSKMVNAINIKKSMPYKQSLNRKWALVQLVFAFFAVDSPIGCMCFLPSASPTNINYYHHAAMMSRRCFSLSSAASTTDVASNPTKQEQAAQKFLIHKGRSKDMIQRSPALSGVSLAENWSADATRALKIAIDKLVQNNPILTGHVYQSNNKKELWIQSGSFPPDQHDFVQEIACPPGIPDFSKLSSQESLKVIETQLIPLFDRCELTWQQIRKRLPLFGVQLMILPHGHAIYSVKMSHAIGDGATFFLLVKAMSLYMSGLDKDAFIDWDCPEKATHELYPPHMSQRDIEFSYGTPFLLGALKNFPWLPFRKTETFLLKKSVVTAKKRELRKQLFNNQISSNDVLTAALCESNQSSDVFIFTQNVRGGRRPGIPVNAGGNFLHEIPVSRQAASQPDQLRLAVQQNGNYQPDQLPLWPFLCGRVGRISSMASLAELVFYKDTKCVCSVPVMSFLAQIPLDVCFIFRYDKEHWGILHNFAKFDATRGLMGELLSKSQNSNSDKVVSMDPAV